MQPTESIPLGGPGILESVFELVWHTNWNTPGCSRCTSTWFPCCITASTLKWDFGQDAHLGLANTRLGLLIGSKRPSSKTASRASLTDSPSSLLCGLAALREILPFWNPRLQADSAYARRKLFTFVFDSALALAKLSWPWSATRDERAAVKFPGGRFSSSTAAYREVRFRSAGDSPLRPKTAVVEFHRLWRSGGLAAAEASVDRAPSRWPGRNQAGSQRHRRLLVALLMIGLAESQRIARIL
jgi:hypothetical protein